MDKFRLNLINKDNANILPDFGPERVNLLNIEPSPDDKRLWRQFDSGKSDKDYNIATNFPLTERNKYLETPRFSIRSMNLLNESDNGNLPLNIQRNIRKLNKIEQTKRKLIGNDKLKNVKIKK